MPLSEHEQRILTEIEQQLYASDPRLAKSASKGMRAAAGSKQLQFGVGGLVVGLAATTALLSVHYLLALLVGVAIVAASLYLIYGHVVEVIANFQPGQSARLRPQERVRREPTDD